jgi:hypothetical protein
MKKEEMDLDKNITVQVILFLKTCYNNLLKNKYFLRILLRKPLLQEIKNKRP